MLKRAGFTLVELVIVMAIVAIGAALAFPGVAQMLSNRQVQSAAESILTGLNQARSEAVRRNTPVNFSLRADRLGWTVAQVAPANTLLSANDPAWRGLTITSAGSADTVTFLPTGLRQAGGTQLSEVTIASTVNDSRTRRIHVFGGGLIRMCDPAVTEAADPRRC